MLVTCLHYDVSLSFLISVLNHVLPFPSASIVTGLFYWVFLNIVVNVNVGASMTSLYYAFVAQQY